MPPFKQLALLALLGPISGRSEELRGSFHRQLQDASNEPERTVVLDRMNDVFSNIKETVDSMDENDEDTSSRLKLIAQKMQPILDNFEIMTQTMKDEHASSEEWEMLVTAVDKYSELQNDIDEKLTRLEANEVEETVEETNESAEVEETVDETNENAELEEIVDETNENAEVEETVDETNESTEVEDEGEVEDVGNRVEMLDNMLVTFDKINTYMSSLKVSEEDKDKLEELAKTMEKYGTAFVNLNEQMKKESASPVAFSKLAETVGKYSALIEAIEDKLKGLKSMESNHEVKELRDILGDVQEELDVGDAKSQYPGTDNVLNYVESRIQRIDENSQARTEIAELTAQLRQRMNDNIAAAAETSNVVLEEATPLTPDVMVLSEMLSDVHQEIMKGDSPIGAVQSELSYLESRLEKLEKTPNVVQLSAMLDEMKQEVALKMEQAQPVMKQQPQVEANESETTDNTKIAEIMANLGFTKDKIDQVQSALNEDEKDSLFLKEEEEAYEVDEEEKEELEKDEEQY